MEHLSPAQSSAYQQLMAVLPVGNVFTLTGQSGSGRTTVLREIHDKIGGEWVTLDPVLNAMREAHPLALEEQVAQCILNALGSRSNVFVDELDPIWNFTVGHACHMYPRTQFFKAHLARLTNYAVSNQKKLFFAERGLLSNDQTYDIAIHRFKCSDYAFLCAQFLPAPLAQSLDYEKIYRFAPRLNAHQLRYACVNLRERGSFDTNEMIEFLRELRMVSNVDLGEVRQVELSELKGIDDVLRSLEANIILPLENDQLATELNLKPKRGVLLAGPPGTGKTTVGRALAHRLRSKFFLIDGTFIAGTQQFYQRIQQVFEHAKNNAPSIIFIDDSDVIFEDRDQSGLYRYLLTMLDGLESESAGRVCVMMTAMDVSKLPPALVRSGRVELWLEMKLPGQDARVEILKQLSANLPQVMKEVEFPAIATATENFTGADLTRLIEDAKTLYAYDRVKNAQLKTPTEYLLQAVETVRANKALYEKAEEHARQIHPVRPPWFDHSFVSSTDSDNED